MIVASRDSVQSILEKIKDETELALDTETTGLARFDTPFLIILADKNEEYLFPIQLLSTTIPIQDLKWFFDLPRRWIFQNAKFDMSMLKRVGLPLSGEMIDDAMVARVINNSYMKYSLDEQAKREGLGGKDLIKNYIKEHDLWEVRLSKLGHKEKVPQFYKVPEEILYPYAAKDARLTYDLFQIYKSKARVKDGNDHVVINNEKTVTKVCFDMEEIGIKVDLDYTTKARQYELDLLTKAKNEFHASCGQPYENKKNLLVPLFRAAGETIKQTAKGNDQLTDKDLDSFSSPLANIVQRIRGHEKLISTYFDNYIDMADDDGIIHPTMWQAGTTTGRFSYSNPNLQNLPREKKTDKPYLVRGCFVPRPGYTFISMDYSQQEYRLMLAHANEKKMIEAVMAGADVHQATADLVKIDRDPAKTVNFAVLYGAGPAKLALMLGISVKAARDLINLYFDKLPMVERFIKSIQRTATDRGEVFNWFGRRLMFEREFCYAAPNHFIQSGGADVIKIAMADMYNKKLFDSELRPVVQVHDQLIYETRSTGFDRLDFVVKSMEDAYPGLNGMKLKVDVAWSDKSMSNRDLQKGFPPWMQGI